MSTSWTAVRVTVPKAYAEAIANRLIELGAPGIEWSEVDDRIRVTGHYAGAAPISRLRRYCAALAGDAEPAWAPVIDTESIAEEDWAENWKLDFLAESVGTRLYVCPSWLATPPAGRLAIVIDPEMAFGTGRHATTRACLALLERACEQHAACRALDVGTGSGVLAIALAKLGAAHVLAIDNDPVALRTAARNAERNGVGRRIRLGSDLSVTAGPYDVIVANLYADLLADLAPRLAALLAETGRLICSGFVEADALHVAATYERRGLHTIAKEFDEGWVTLDLRPAHS
jgi:ribosomal protein L11 methyltransferase